MAETTTPQRELTKAEILQVLTIMARRLDQQTASFAALTSVLTTLPETKRCQPHLAMSAAAMMIPDGPGAERLKAAAAANALSIITTASQRSDAIDQRRKRRAKPGGNGAAERLASSTQTTAG